MSKVPAVTLNDGQRMPQLGLGVWQASDDEAERAVSEALRVGYRSIDTAKIYENERGVGRAIAKSGLRREDVFLTTKLWNSDQGHRATLDAIDASLERLGSPYVDLYLVHWPRPSRDLYLETWKAMIEIRASGRARSIGVSNFEPEHLDRIVRETGIVPTVNQIELHPRFAQKKLRDAHAKHGIVTEAWSPLGQGKLLEDASLRELASRRGKTVAQIILRWHLQRGFVVIPKSVRPARIAENFEVFDFELTPQELTAIDQLDRADGRIGPDPMTAAF